MEQLRPSLGRLDGMRQAQYRLSSEKSQLRAWETAGGTFDCVSLKAELHYTKSAKGPFFRLTLHPLALDDSYRLARRYGFDRFIVLQVPSLGSEDLPSYVPCDGEQVREAIIEWLVSESHFLLGREWRAFYLKPRQGRKISTKDASKSEWRAYMFAIDGHSFQPPGCPSEFHERLSVWDLVNWFMPFHLNTSASALKLFSRLQLAVSSTTPTIVFSLNQIVRCDDAISDASMPRRLSAQRHNEKLAGTELKSHGKVMSDGCARISGHAAKQVAEKLGILDHVPNTFQARINGSKGLWVVDGAGETLNGEAAWIEIADSQSKFEGHNGCQYDRDDKRLTFEVLSFSRFPSPAKSNTQLMPILISRGVNETRLEKDLQEKAKKLLDSMQDPLSLRAWNQDHNPVKALRLEADSIEWEGGMPKSDEEKLNLLIESGFDPKYLEQLQKLCHKMAKEYCTRLGARVHIEIGQSTSVFMVPDFANVLEEGEIHLGFSSKFVDEKSGFCDTMVHGRDVLVARNPAALPSDIQKVSNWNTCPNVLTHSN